MVQGCICSQCIQDELSSLRSGPRPTSAIIGMTRDRRLTSSLPYPARENYIPVIID